MWSVVFFVASAAASSAYLTVSELFPVELRGMAIALFYATGTATGGVAAPAIFSRLIQSGSRERVFYGYLFGAGLMLFAALMAIVPIDPSMSVAGPEWSVGGVGGVGSVDGGAQGSSGGGFGGMLSNAISSLEQTQTDAAKASQSLVDGTATVTETCPHWRAGAGTP